MYVEVQQYWNNNFFYREEKRQSVLQSHLWERKVKAKFSIINLPSTSLEALYVPYNLSWLILNLFKVFTRKWRISCQRRKTSSGMRIGSLKRVYVPIYLKVSKVKTKFCSAWTIYSVNKVRRFIYRIICASFFSFYIYFENLTLNVR